SDVCSSDLETGPPFGRIRQQGCRKSLCASVWSFSQVPAHRPASTVGCTQPGSRAAKTQHQGDAIRQLPFLKRWTKQPYSQLQKSSLSVLANLMNSAAI